MLDISILQSAIFCISFGCISRKELEPKCCFWLSFYLITQFLI